MPEPFYTGQQIADLWSVDYETVLALAQSGELESVRIGRARRYPASAVDAYAARHWEPRQERASNETTTT